MIIQNRDKLLAHGQAASRQTVLDILESGMAAGDPYANVLDCLRIEGNKLIVGNERFLPGPINASKVSDHARPFPVEPLVFDLDQVRNIYVVGGGKAAQRMAEAMEQVLGDRISAGHICAKKGDSIRLKRIGVTLAGHPIPDEESVSGARQILAIEQSARAGDIVFVSMSGGGTALLTCPAPGLTLHDLQEVNRVLYFEHGAPIPVANAVRGVLAVLRLKHSRYVGEATMLQFVTTEVPPNTRPLLKDTTPTEMNDFEYAIALLHEYDCWDEIPESVRQFLLRADPAHVRLKPEEWWDRPHFNFRVMGPEVMLAAALARARALGLNADILISSTSSLDARNVGEMAGLVAREIALHRQAGATPRVWLLGGELVVSTGKQSGLGGRNQEFALASALHIAGLEQVVIASADSDGRDGPGEHAGAIVDGQTVARAQALGIDLLDVLYRHDTDPAFRALGDAVNTGVLHTNIQDLRVIYVGGQ